MIHDLSDYDTIIDKLESIEAHMMTSNQTEKPYNSDKVKQTKKTNKTSKAKGMGIEQFADSKYCKTYKTHGSQYFEMYATNNCHRHWVVTGH